MTDLPKDVEVRAAIVTALEADLIGRFYPPGHGARPGAGPPDPGASADEVLKLPPSRWYLTGFVAPERSREEAHPTAADELGAAVDDDAEQDGPEPQPKQPPRLPASIGMRARIPGVGARSGK